MNRMHFYPNTIYLSWKKELAVPLCYHSYQLARARPHTDDTNYPAKETVKLLVMYMWTDKWFLQGID